MKKITPDAPDNDSGWTHPNDKDGKIHSSQVGKWKTSEVHTIPPQTKLLCSETGFMEVYMFSLLLFIRSTHTCRFVGTQSSALTLCFDRKQSAVYYFHFI